MARKRFSDEDILKVLRQVEVDLSSGNDIKSACRNAGISDATYYTWRKRLMRRVVVATAQKRNFVELLYISTKKPGTISGLHAGQRKKGII